LKNLIISQVVIPLLAIFLAGSFNPQPEETEPEHDWYPSWSPIENNP
jgi:hypothetical protein